MTPPDRTIGAEMDRRTEAAAEWSAAELRVQKSVGWFKRLLPPPEQGGMPAEAFAALLLSQVRRNRKLMQAANNDPDSLLFAATDCAARNLVPGDEYWFVPFEDRKGGTGLHVTGMPGWKGEVQQIYRSGMVRKVFLDLAYKGDKWDWRPTRMDTPDWEPTAEDRTAGNLWKAIAFAEFHGGGISQVVVLNEYEISIREAVSKAPKADFWQNPKWRPRMWRKDLDVRTPIPTPSGWSTMGQMQPGDVVLDLDGQPVRVLGCSEVQHNPCYEVRFTTGEPIICGEDHLWVARIGDSGNRTRVYQAKDLYAAKRAGKAVVIPVTRPLELPDADLPVDPWVLGYWLGNGHKGSGEVTCHGDDTAEVAAAVASAGYPVGAVREDPRANATAIGIRRLAKPLAELGVAGDKHVPAIYLRGSFGQRLALLRGLLDSDGSVWQREGTAGRVKFGSTRVQLRDAVAELARSLGEQVMTLERDCTGFGKTVRSFEVSWTPTAEVPFALSRKAGKTRLRARASYGHRVKSIEPVPSVPTRCIGVDSPTHTYLAGAAMIPTHNSGAHELFDLVPHSAGYNTRLMEAYAVAAERFPAIQSAGEDREDAALPAPPPVDMPPGAIPGRVEHPSAPVMGGSRLPARNGTRDDDGWPDGAQPPADVRLPAEDVTGGETAADSTTPAADETPAQPGDEPLITPQTMGRLNSMLQRDIGWKGPDFKERRKVVTGILAAGEGETVLTLESATKLTERQGRQAEATLAEIISGQADAAETLQELFDSPDPATRLRELLGHPAAGEGTSPQDREDH